MNDSIVKQQFSSLQKNSIQTTLTGTKKLTKWVSPAFDFELSVTEPHSSSKSQKRDLYNAFGNHQQTKQPESSNQSQVVKRTHVENILTWTDKHAPSSVADLAVHKKKIQELETWIKNNSNGKKPAPILLLTGPAGVGKTTTLKVLAKQLKCEIQEWVNPTSVPFNSEFISYSESKLGNSSYQSQKNLFQDFFLRANKYRSLNLFGEDHFGKKLVLVEDYPNIFFQNPSTFHDIVRKYVMTGNNPLVFIVSDSTHGNSNEKLLFPKDFQNDLNIDHISFNPVALTILTKVLTRIATQESLKGTYKFSIPSKSTLESLAMSSNGDVRGAINALQFACLKDTTNILNTFTERHTSKTKSKSCVSKGKNKSRTKSLGENLDSMPCIGGKDSSLFLFHALGKILYCKREEPKCENQESRLLPPHLSHHERWPLIENPEEVVNKSHLSEESFLAFLQQNYVNFFEKIEDLERASEYLSDADYITYDWATRSALQNYTVSLATRGLMHSNSTIRHQGKSWRPLHKPEFFSVQRKMKNMCTTVQEEFSPQLSRVNFVNLFTELIPYLSLTNATLQSSSQISILQEITSFPKFKSRLCLEKLEEGDLVNAENSFKSENNSFPTTSTQSIVATDKEMVLEPEEEDEEIVIEEFED